MANPKLTYNTTPSLFFWKDIASIQSKLLTLTYNKNVAGVPTPTPFFEQDKSSVFAVVFEATEESSKLVAYDVSSARQGLINAYPPQSNLQSYVFFTVGDIDNEEGTLYSVEMSMYVVMDSTAFNIGWNKLEAWLISIIQRDVLPVRPNGAVQNLLINTKKDAFTPISGIVKDQKFYYPPYNVIRFDFDLLTFNQLACEDTISEEDLC